MSQSTRRILKQRMVDAMGGVCQKCLNQESAAAMDFHHVDPKTKKFRLGGNEMNRQIGDYVEELKKCILLCSNCHRKLHSGEFGVPDTYVTLNEEKFRNSFVCLECEEVIDQTDRNLQITFCSASHQSRYTHRKRKENIAL